MFYEQAVEACEKMRELFDQEGGALCGRYHVCHGELNQHHILMGRTYVAVTEFNKMHLGLQTEDLYYFMRKVMEKHDWDRRLGLSMLEAYERVLPLSDTDRACLYCLFLYPEKYWKQINFYYNANKAWIPEKNATPSATIRKIEIKRALLFRISIQKSLCNAFIPSPTIQSLPLVWDVHFQSSWKPCRF